MTRTIPGATALDDLRIAVLGLGISGRSALDTLKATTSAQLSAWDARGDARADYADLDGGADTDPVVLIDNVLAWNPDVVVISPAFPMVGVEWTMLREAGVSVWSEIELAWHLRATNKDGEFAPWLVITGTNGKTTTVSMLASILQHAGLRGMAVGNVGTPAVAAVSSTAEDAPGAFALELSSFQLAATGSMEPAGAICLNVADDHLEWHGTREHYRDSKARIYGNVHGARIFPVGDEAVESMVHDAPTIAGTTDVGIVFDVPGPGRIGLVEDIVVDRAFVSDHAVAAQLFELSDIAHFATDAGVLPVHILKDALAAAALARSIGVAPEHIGAGLRAVSGGSHRIETVETINGVRYIDDSKATNAHAAEASVRALDSAVWIVGGQAKGARFTELVAKIEPHLRAVVVIGVDQSPWHEALDGTSVPVHYVTPDEPNPMREAVRKASEFAQGGDTVILAPASASMDQFTSYSDRGEQFSRAVRGLGGQRASS